MRKFIVGAALVAAAAAPLSAQESVTGGGKPSVFSITPYVGYVIWGDFFETQNGLEYTQDNSGMFGAEATIDIGRAVSLVGNFGYSKTNFEFERGGNAPQEFAASQEVGTFLYDGGLRFRLPFTNGMTSFAPYLQLGAGAVRYSFDTDDFNAEGTTTNVAYHAAVGTTFKVMGLGVRGEVKDYITSLNWERPSQANDFNDIDKAGIQHNWALSLGLTFAF
jgi:opacity protein-like surface antigen